jgi:hypothetical protein
MTKEEVIDCCLPLLARRWWNWYGTLYLRTNLPLWRANRGFSEWISEIEEAEADDFSAISE